MRPLPDCEPVSSRVSQLHWTQSLLIQGGCRPSGEREFHPGTAARKRWTKRQLERQIAGALFERALAPPKEVVRPAMRQIHPSAPGVPRGPHHLLEFPDLPERLDKSDLRGALVANLKKFRLELGRKLRIVGEHCRLQVGARDFLIDLLFFHRGLRCLVAFELKTEDFQPAHPGQLSFHLEAPDRDVRLPEDNPCAGVLPCKSHDHDAVGYALSRTLSPALVAEYQTKLPDKAMLRARLERGGDTGMRKDEG